MSINLIPLEYGGKSSTSHIELDSYFAKINSIKQNAVVKVIQKSKSIFLKVNFDNNSHMMSRPEMRHCRINTRTSALLGGIDYTISSIQIELASLTDVPKCEYLNISTKANKESLLKYLMSNKFIVHPITELVEIDGSVIPFDVISFNPSVSSALITDNTKIEFSEIIHNKTTNNVSNSNMDNNNGVKVDNDETSLDKNDLILKEIPDISFNDIAGLDLIKEKIESAIVHPFTHEDKYKKWGVSPGGSILLYGPPGCGKTMIAKAAAKECGTVFINVDLKILSKFVGETEKNIAKIFEVARSCKKAIVFFDEIDSIAQQRSDRKEGYDNKIVIELLTQMDGFANNKNILFLAATNQPWSLDDAITRPGRFDNPIFIPEPDIEAREYLFENELKDVPKSNDIDYKMLAEKTKSYSAADIVALRKDVAENKLSEELKTGKDDLLIEHHDLIKALEGRESSILSWYIKSKREIKFSGMENKYKEVMNRNINEES